jgi:hypothetical protein
MHFKRLMVARHFQQYCASPPSTNPPKPGLRTVKLQPGVSRYLYHDTKNSAVLRARLRFDLNGLQLGVVATRVATCKRMQLERSGTDEVEIADHDAEVELKSRCNLCGLVGSDSRLHLLTRCLALDSQRCDCQFDMHLQTWNQRLDRSCQLRALACAPTRSVELFMLGELNCAKSSSEHPSVITEITSTQSLSRLDGPANPQWNRRATRLAVRERILTTSCGCAYPALSVEKRLASSALFIRHLFRARFPGTAGTATDLTAVSIMAEGGPQSQSNLNINGSSLLATSPGLK